MLMLLLLRQEMVATTEVDAGREPRPKSKGSEQVRLRTNCYLMYVQVDGPRKLTTSIDATITGQISKSSEVLGVIIGPAKIYSSLRHLPPTASYAQIRLRC